MNTPGLSVRHQQPLSDHNRIRIVAAELVVIYLICTTGQYLEGHGDVVSRLMIGIDRVTMWVTGVINLLTKSPRQLHLPFHAPLSSPTKMTPPLQDSGTLC